MAEIKKMGYCVNGEWKESKAEKYMDVTDSSTGEVIAQRFFVLKSPYTVTFGISLTPS